MSSQAGSDLHLQESQQSGDGEGALAALHQMTAMALYCSASTVQNLISRYRDPTKRPTAREALAHPWLRGTSADRSTGKPLDQTVVQRVQVGCRACLCLFQKALLHTSISGSCLPCEWPARLRRRLPAEPT